MLLSRRTVIAGGVCAGLCGAHASHSEVLPRNLPRLVESGYDPIDADERGLWQSFERLEEALASSDQLLDAPELLDYTSGVVERLVGRPVPDLRIYLVRDAEFNATMAPTGMMVVHSGLLARMRNEAQYAAVLGHEAGHYFRKHSVEGHRSRRTKAAIGAFVSAGAGAMAGYSSLQGIDGRSWIDLAASINAGLLESMFRFNREQEVEADAFGLAMISKAGYEPASASEIWRQLIEERQQSAAERGRRYRPSALNAYSTHPPEASRMRDLSETADMIRLEPPSQGFTDGRDAWRRVIGPYQFKLLEEQVKLNDPGASLYLIESLGRDGWTGTLRYAEGEVYRLRNGEGDALRAASSYASAIEYADAPAEAWRAHGYALVKSGQRTAGQQALRRYLEASPSAKDAAMVRFALQP